MSKPPQVMPISIFNPTSNKKEAASFIADLRTQAASLGFNAIGITRPNAVDLEADLLGFLAAGNHGSMNWLAARPSARAHPDVLWPPTRSIVVVGMNYHQPEGDLLAKNRDSSCGVISVYAGGDDYHKVIHRRLRNLGRWISAQRGGQTKALVDTGTVMEKPLAMAAGLGWQGKHTNLVSKEFGSWLFLGVILSDVDLPIMQNSGTDTCGSCRACVRACPTNALATPYQIDARRCISYLTIEHHGPIPTNLRTAIGNRIYGCDDCLAVCPWNKFAQRSQEIRFARRQHCDRPNLKWSARLSAEAFADYFRGSPITRIGHERWLRNVMIALGNAGTKSVLPDIIRQLRNRNALVRGAAVWAISRHASQAEMVRLWKMTGKQEKDHDVKSEWNSALSSSYRGSRTPPALSRSSPSRRNNHMSV